MARPLPQPIRTIYGIYRVLIKTRLMPGPAAAVKVPQAERLAGKPPGFMIGKVDTDIRTWDDTVKGRGGPIPVRVYARPDLRPGAPAIFFLHGGGFIQGGLDHTDHLQRALAARTGYVVVGASYRLAPEHPFPAAFEDCQDVLQWMVEEQPQGLDPQRLAIAGESAGANLAAAVVIANRDGAKHSILHQTIVYPFTDTTLSSSDWDTSGMPGTDRSAGELMVRLYAGAEKDNPLINLLGADLAGLPPAMVISCEHDPLRTDSIRYAEALRAAGVPTHHRHYDNMPHGYLVLPGVIREARSSLEEIAAEMMKRLGPETAVS
ncbi:alpha/beta hydrolase [Nocardia sp. NPDC056100]|uniref:alpha/beta hydrolase n=1 Tax=Nocardia sp. NPDC056100 TaxID=3345712 RepID=UPI0035E18090